jgi:hypothetical protein
MADNTYSADRGETQASRFGGIARGGADFLRRTLSVAAQEEMNQVREQTVERLTPVARSTGFMVGGGALAAYGGAYIVHGIVRALSTRMPPWLASLLVGVALGLGGAALMEVGRREIKDADPTSSEDDRS